MKFFSFSGPMFEDEKNEILYRNFATHLAQKFSTYKLLDYIFNTVSNFSCSSTKVTSHTIDKKGKRFSLEIKWILLNVPHVIMHK